MLFFMNIIIRFIIAADHVLMRIVAIYICDSG